jgi:steroid delta-isomerase-like uncharacterized protein
MFEENKALANRLYTELINRADLSIADELVAEDFVDHNPPGPDMAPGREGLKQVFTEFNSAFPNMTLTVEDQVAEGDKVVSRLRFSGTQQGEFNGMPESGKSVSIGIIDIFRIEEGKIVERWGESDTLGMLVQLGAVPPPGA